MVSGQEGRIFFKSHLLISSTLLIIPFLGKLWRLLFEGYSIDVGKFVFLHFHRDSLFSH